MVLFNAHTHLYMLVYTRHFCLTLQLCYMLLGTGMECDAVLLMGSLITVISNSYYSVENIQWDNFLVILILCSCIMNVLHIGIHFRIQVWVEGYEGEKEQWYAGQRVWRHFEIQGIPQDNLCRTQMKLFWNSAPWVSPRIRVLWSSS